MASHSSILAWIIPMTEEPGRLPSMESQRVGHCIAGYLGFIPRLGRYLGEGHGNLLQYYCLENPMERRRQTTVYGVTKSQT